MILVLVIPFSVAEIGGSHSDNQEISMVGPITSIIALLLDQVGSSVGYWTYPYTFTPLAKDLWAVADFSIPPL